MSDGEAGRMTDPPPVVRTRGMPFSRGSTPVLALGSPWPDQRGPAIRARMDAKEPPTNVGAWLGFRLYFPVAACFT